MKKEQKNWLSSKIQIVDSPIHGRGVLAISNIREGEKLIVWRDSYTDKVGAMEAERQGKSTMQWDDDIYSYETEDKSDYYSINHSCNPNSWMEDAYTLTARRDIKDGEEITADYALWETDENFVSIWNCNCSSPLCRGKVTGKDWMSSELQDRYKDHFSPLINKRTSIIDPVKQHGS